MKIRTKSDLDIESLLDEWDDEFFAEPVEARKTIKVKSAQISADDLDLDDLDDAPPVKAKAKKEEIATPFLTFADLVPDQIYGVRCYSRRTFGTTFYPAAGWEIKRIGDDQFEYGAVPHWRGVPLPDKNCFLLQPPRADGRYLAVKLYDGLYTPPLLVYKIIVCPNRLKTTRTEIPAHKALTISGKKLNILSTNGIGSTLKVGAKPIKQS